MLLDIFVTVPSLLMTTIAWYINVGLVLLCLIAPLAIAIGAIVTESAQTMTPCRTDHHPRRYGSSCTFLKTLYFRRA